MTAAGTSPTKRRRSDTDATSDDDEAELVLSDNQIDSEREDEYIAPIKTRGTGRGRGRGRGRGTGVTRGRGAANAAKKPRPAKPAAKSPTRRSKKASGKAVAKSVEEAKISDDNALFSSCFFASRCLYNLSLTIDSRCNHES